MKTNMNTQAVKPKTNSTEFTEYAVSCVLTIQALIFVVAQRKVNRSVITLEYWYRLIRD